MRVKELFDDYGKNELELLTDKNDIENLGKKIKVDLSCYPCIYVFAWTNTIFSVYGCLNDIPYMEEEIYVLY
jgi:hypothetical protein